MSSEPAADFQYFQQSPNGRVFANLPISSIRENPEQPPLLYLQHYLEANQNFTPQYFEEEQNREVDELSGTEQLLFDITRELARSEGLDLKAAACHTEQLQVKIRATLDKVQRLEQVLQSNKIEIARFPESQAEIKNIRQTIQQKQAVLRTLDVFEQLTQTGKLVEQLLYMGDVPTATFILSMSEAVYYNRLQIFHADAQQDLLSGRKQVERAIRKEIEKCVYIIQGAGDDTFAIKCEIKEFNSIKGIDQYFKYLNDLRLSLCCKRKTVEQYYDFRRNIGDISGLLADVWREYHGDMQHLQELSTSSGLSGLEKQSIGVQEYILLLCQSLMMLERSSRFLPNYNFSLFEEIQHMLDSNVHSYYNEINRYLAKTNHVLDENLFDNIEIKITMNDVQTARYALLCPNGCDAKDYQMVLYCIYQSIKNIYIFDIGVHILQTTNEKLQADIIKTFTLLSDRKFIVNVGQLPVFYSIAHIPDENKVLNLKELIRQFYQLYMQYFYYLNGQDIPQNGDQDSFFRKEEDVDSKLSELAHLHLGNELGEQMRSGQITLKKVQEIFDSKMSLELQVEIDSLKNARNQGDTAITIARGKNMPDKSFMQHFHVHYHLFVALYEGFEYYRIDEVIEQNVCDNLMQLQKEYFSSIEELYGHAFSEHVQAYKQEQIPHLDNVVFKRFCDKMTEIVLNGKQLDFILIYDIVCQHRDLIYGEFTSILEQSYCQLTSYQVAFHGYPEVTQIKLQEMKHVRQAVVAPSKAGGEYNDREITILGLKSMHNIVLLMRMIEFLNIERQFQELTNVIVHKQSKRQEQEGGAKLVLENKRQNNDVSLSLLQQKILLLVSYEQKLQISYYLNKYRQLAFGDERENTPMTIDRNVLLLKEIIAMCGQPQHQELAAKQVDQIVDVINTVFLQKNEKYSAASIKHLAYNLELLLEDYDSTAVDALVDRMKSIVT